MSAAWKGLESQPVTGYDARAREVLGLNALSSRTPKQEAHDMAKYRPLPPLEQLRALFRADPTSPSGLRWVKMGRSRRRDLSVGTLCGGYWATRLNGRRVGVHRLLWALVHGEDPGDLQVDHIDGNPSNNELSNLRLATNAQNSHNRAKLPGSRSRWRGVSRANARTGWVAQVCHEGARHYFGTFGCPTAAAIAFDRGAIALHGEFARTNIIDAHLEKTDE